MTEGRERPSFAVLETGAVQSAESHPRSTFRRAASAVETVAGWSADRIEDAAGWLANLVRYGPARVARVFMTLGAAIFALLRFGPSIVRIARIDRRHAEPFLVACARRGGIRAIQVVLEVADLIGAPEIFAFMWRVLTRTSPLTGAEIAAATAVLGPNAVRYQDIRIAQGGVLRWVFARNGQRAFATFHTINLPAKGRHQRENTDIVVHEIIHVYQYERAGSRYFAEALLGQREEGYNYGGPEGLKSALGQGKRLKNFNREQQAQIAQDYYAAIRTRGDLAPYEPFIRQLREGWI
ncbi:MAG: hypothetical protein ACM30E_10765 [Nitrososphaerales archaeon]